MFTNLKKVMVELNTPKGSAFSGQADAVELRTTDDGLIAINAQEECFLNLTQITEITLRIGAEFLTFVLRNAAASLRDGHLTVIAEEITPKPSAPISTAPKHLPL